jgi:DNA-binding GntR family transcriptional regulator
MDRPNLSNGAVAYIRRRIVTGALADGTRLNEVRLAEALGISRTPLREALGQLVAAGLVEVRPRRGFFVKPLTSDEAREIYPVRRLLDPAALREGGIPPTPVLHGLRATNERLAATGDDSTARVDIDDAWHRRLIGHCSNRHLLRLIDHHMTRTRRYELAWFAAGGSLGTATDEHDAILDALDSANLDAACAALAHNLETALPHLIAWLDTRADHVKMESPAFSQESHYDDVRDDLVARRSLRRRR